MNNSTTTGENWVIVDHLTTCKRCKTRDLAWQKGFSGKFYLCRGRRNTDGTFSANRRDFHRCPEPNHHGVRVTDQDIPF